MPTPRTTLILGDSREQLLLMPENLFDSVVTDPPYEISMGGAKWDSTGIANDKAFWGAVLRVLKPGGHMLAFGAPRTCHRMTCAIEDAGFEIRDSIVYWHYAQGFPKNLSLGGGLGTSLKPAGEPIVMARKPVSEATIKKNLEVHGTGGINIDGCRVEGGRWPSNAIFSEEAVAELDAQSGVRKSGSRKAGVRTGMGYHGADGDGGPAIEASEGGASRFFFVAKASRKERDAGCEDLPVKSGGEVTNREEGSAGLDNPRAGAGRTGGVKNHHISVKPLALMKYLVRLVTPPGGHTLDPFLGSGTTGCAAVLEGFRFTGIEQSAEYLEIATARIAHYEKEKP